MTLVELLVVIAIIGALAALLLPTLSNAKASGKQASCLNNLKQSEMACQMYATDNGGKLVRNAAFAPPLASLFGETEETNGWVYGNMKTITDSTNLSYVRNGKLFPYLSQATPYHCPADATEANGWLRLRSYSMNSWVWNLRDGNAGTANRLPDFPERNRFCRSRSSGRVGSH